MIIDIIGTAYCGQRYATNDLYFVGYLYWNLFIYIFVKRITINVCTIGSLLVKIRTTFLIADIFIIA
jgi:hypothetical protein